MIDPMTGVDDGQDPVQDPTKPKVYGAPAQFQPTYVAPAQFRTDATSAPGPAVDPTASYDKVTGAPIKVRLALAAAGPKDRLELAKTLLPGVHDTPHGLAFTGPEGKPTLVEPNIMGNPNMHAQIGNLLTAPGKIGTALGAILGGIVGTPADAVSGPAGTVAGAALGGAAGGATGRLVQKIESMIAGAPSKDTSTPLESLAQTGQDAVSGAGQEVLGGLAGLVAKGAARAGSRTAARAAAADAAGTDLSVGQTLNSPIVKGLETATAVLPTGRGVMGRFGAKQADQLGTQAQHIAGLIAGGEGAAVPASAEEAGNLIQGRAKQVLDQWQAEIPTRQQAVADAITAANPRGVVVPLELRSTAKALQSAAESKTSQLADAAVPAAEKAADIMKRANANGGVIPAKEMLALRTELNDLAYKGLDGANRTSGQTRKFQELVQSLDRDIGRTVNEAEKTSPGAAAAWEDYNAHVASARAGGGGRSGAESKVDLLEKLIGQTPGDAYKTATNVANNAGSATRMRDMLGSDVYQQAAARHFLDLGNATPAGGGAGVFSPEAFFKNWNGKGMTPEVKQALYAGADPMHPAIAPFTETIKNVASSAPFRNPSGTAGMLQGTQFLRDLLSVPAMAQEGAVGAMTHSPAALAATTLGPMAAAKGFTGRLPVGVIEALAKGTKTTGGTLSDILSRIFPLQ